MWKERWPWLIIKSTIFVIDNNKAPGVDRFDAYFFKKVWDVIGKDLIEAIKFFATSSLLQEVNCTIISLVPKCANPSFCKDYMPISCCNFIYKCISKIIAHRLKELIPLFIDGA